MSPSSRATTCPTPGVPESFKVLVKELQSLCLDIQVLDEDGNEIELKEDEDAMDTFNLAARWTPRTSADEATTPTRANWRTQASTDVADEEVDGAPD